MCKLSDPTPQWSKNSDPRFKFPWGDFCYDSRSGSRHSHCELYDRIWVLSYIFLLCDLTLHFFTLPFSLWHCNTSLIQYNQQESMKAEAGSRIGTAAFLDGIVSQREVRNHKKRDCLFSTANNSTPEKKAQPCWQWEKGSSGILNIFHTPWRIMPEYFVGKQGTEESTLQSLSRYLQGLWKPSKSDPCYTAQSPHADLLARPVPQWSHSTIAIPSSH